MGGNFELTHLIIYLILLNRLFCHGCRAKIHYLFYETSVKTLKECGEFLGTNFLEEKLRFAFNRHH